MNHTDLKIKSRPQAQLEIVNPFRPIYQLFKRVDPIQKSKNRLAELRYKLKAEEAKLLYLSGQDDPKIKKYIRRHYKIYLDMEHVPSIPVICPHCNLNIVLSKKCPQCEWALAVYFRDEDQYNNNMGDLLATPTLQSPIRKNENLIYVNQIPFNNSFRREQRNRPLRPDQFVRLYPKKPHRQPRRPSVDSDISEVVNKKKTHSSKVREPDRVVKND